MDASQEATEVDNFRPVFKRFRSRQRRPEEDRVEVEQQAELLELLSPIEDVGDLPAETFTSVGLRPDTATWRVFRGPRGVLLARNPFEEGAAAEWASRCLEQYARPPFRTNLDAVDGPVSSANWLQTVERGRDAKVASRLRWATLGYHHNWDTKVYSETDVTEMPQDLRTLTQVLARVLLGQRDYRAEAAIVNFYPCDANLGPHTDHSEPNQSAPLFSVSLGLDAVFLLGGATRRERPVPMLLRSGDVLVMTGEARRCFHAVPKIIKDSFCDETSGAPTVSDWYLQHHRININVRQVH